MSATPDAVSLVRMTDCHLATTYRWLSSLSQLRRQVDCLEPPSEQGNKDYWHRRWQDECRRDFAIVTTDHRHVGNCGLCDLDWWRRKAQLWIYLGEEYGKGIGGSAVDRLLTLAFDELGLNRIYLRVVASNQRAIIFYQSLGFVTEGCLREDTFIDGRPVDSICMAVLRRDYASEQLKRATR